MSLWENWYLHQSTTIPKYSPKERGSWFFTSHLYELSISSLFLSPCLSKSLPPLPLGMKWNAACPACHLICYLHPASRWVCQQCGISTSCLSLKNRNCCHNVVTGCFLQPLVTLICWLSANTGCRLSKPSIIAQLNLAAELSIKSV